MKNNNLIKLILGVTMMVILESCGAVKPQVPAHAVSKKKIAANAKVDNKKSLEKNKDSEYVLNIKTPIKTEGTNYIQTVKAYTKKDMAQDNNTYSKVPSNSQVVKDPIRNDNTSSDRSYSNYIRVKTVYELAMDANPSMFLPHDEFETADEYKKRVSGQVSLMKEIVQMTSQKMEIKKAQRLQVAKEKEQKSKNILENMMAESSSSIEFTPTDIGRYNPENETFPIILHNTQYQISVPREEARTFKTNFKSVKIKGLKQLKPQYDVSVKVSKAHIRSRPNGSIVGIASRGDHFEHVQDEDEWYKINYKGQFGFTHMNNAELKLIDIADSYEYHDMVAIHPTTGSMFAMTSVDKLVKAPLNLASRKLFESGQPDGPKE
tara:strand:- start:59 stop:1189 length:1131 start_codon:yes stop_codon:yes gene_type:complete